MPRRGRTPRSSRSTRATWSAAGRSCLKSGDYLLPIYHETGHDPEQVGPDSTSLFLRFNPAKRTWTKTGPIRSPKGNIQPAVVELDNGDLVAYCRRGGDYDPKTIGYIVRSESHDGGMTWSEGKDSAFPNPNAAVDFIKLKSGRLLLIFNDSMNHRTPLTAALSSDQDRTWPVRRNIREGPGDFGYPTRLTSPRRPHPPRFHVREAKRRQPRGL